MKRIYLDYNATSPLRPEARAAMIAAMDAVGNPSSVHTEGRAAKAIVEKARGQVADLIGCDTSEVVFTSGATEAAAIVSVQPYDTLIYSDAEHDALHALSSKTTWQKKVLPLQRDGQIDLYALVDTLKCVEGRALLVVQAANSETGVLQNLGEIMRFVRQFKLDTFVDVTQVIGKLNLREYSTLNWRTEQPTYCCFSAHKFGGPTGVGALIVRGGTDLHPILLGGGQEMNRRSGTQNVLGISGFGAMAEAIPKILGFYDDNSAWWSQDNLRNILEKTLEDCENKTIFVGKDSERLPNTSCIMTPGWKGETQVMALDLAGFAVSAGSACSSGKVTSSRVLKAMGYSEEEAGSAIRVSLGPETTEDEVAQFCETFIDLREKHWQRSARLQGE